MTVTRTTELEVTVPVKILAREVASAIAHDYSVIEVMLKDDGSGKVQLYLGGAGVFVEPGE